MLPGASVLKATGDPASVPGKHGRSHGLDIQVCHRYNIEMTPRKINVFIVMKVLHMLYWTIGNALRDYPSRRINGEDYRGML